MSHALPRTRVDRSSSPSPLRRAAAAASAMVLVAAVSLFAASPAHAAGWAVTTTIDVGQQPAGVAVAPDGSRVYVANRGDNTVSVIDTATGAVSHTIPVGFYPVAAAVAPGGAHVWIALSGDDSIAVIDTTTNAITGSVAVGGDPADVAFSPDGTRAYVPAAAGASVAVIDTATLTVTTTVPVGSGPWTAAVSLDGARVFVLNQTDNTVSVIETATHAVTATLPVIAEPSGVAVNPVTGDVYVANSSWPALSVIDPATLAVTSVALEQEPRGIDVSPDGTRVYLSNWTGTTASVLDLATGTVTDTVTVGSEPAALAVSPADGRVYVANTNGTTVSVLAGPATLPGAPTDLTATPETGGVALTWAAPVYTGGADLTDHLIEYSSEPGVWQTFTHTPSPQTNTTVTGLDDHVEYTFRVSAVNSVGTGGPSATATATTLTAPVAPVLAQVQPGDSNLYVSWTEPYDGGSPVTSYTVTVHDGTTAVATRTVTGHVLGTLVTGLVNTHEYTVTVVATNAAGVGPSSVASAPVAPAAGGPVDTLGRSFALGALASDVALSPDGTRVYTAAGGAVTAIDVATGTALGSVPVGPDPLDLALTPDGGLLYVTLRHDSVVVVDTTSLTVVATVDLGSGWQTQGVLVSPDGAAAYVLVVSEGLWNFITIDTATNAILSRVGHLGPDSATPPRIGAISPDGTRIYATADSSDLLIFNTASGQVAGTIAVGQDPYDVAITADGATVYVTNLSANSVSIVNTATGAVTATIPVGQDPEGIQVAPDDKTLYVATTGTSTISVVDIATGTVQTIPVDRGPARLAVSHDGGRLFTTTSSGTALVELTGTPPTVPAAPTGLTTTPGAGQVTLSWTAPDDGKRPITAYTPEISADGGTTWTVIPHDPPTGTSATATGLTNGTEYLFRVSATNALGTGPTSAPVEAAPIGPPGAPTGLTAQGQDRSVALSWTPPADDGGAPVTDYLVEYSADGGTTWTPFPHTHSPTPAITVTGLTNGTQYTFRVAAVTVLGTGPASQTAVATPDEGLGLLPPLPSTSASPSTPGTTPPGGTTKPGGQLAATGSPVGAAALAAAVLILAGAGLVALRRRGMSARGIGG